MRAPRSMSIIGAGERRGGRAARSRTRGFGAADIASPARPPRVMPSAARLVREVRQRRASRVSNARVGLAQLAPRAPPGGRASSAARGHARRPRRGPARLASPIACAARVALGAQLVDLGLQRAAPLVEREHLVEQAVGLAARERRAHARRCRSGSGGCRARADRRRPSGGCGSGERLEQLRDAVVVHRRDHASRPRRLQALVGVRDGQRRSRPSRASRGRSRRRRTRRTASAREAEQVGRRTPAPLAFETPGAANSRKYGQRLRDERAARRSAAAARRAGRPSPRACPTVTILVVGRSIQSARSPTTCIGDAGDLRVAQRRLVLLPARRAGRRCRGSSAARAPRASRAGSRAPAAPRSAGARAPRRSRGRRRARPGSRRAAGGCRAARRRGAPR